MDHRAAGEQPGGDDPVAGAMRLELALFDDLLPDPTLQAGNQIAGRALADDAAVADNRHGRTEVGHVFNNVSREDHHHVLADLGQQVEEAVALFGVEACGGLIDDDQAGVANQGLGDAETLAHAAGEAGDGLLAHGPQIGLVEQRLDRLLAILRVGDALEHGHVVEHVVGRHPRIDAEVLRQIAQRPAQLFRVLEHVDGAEADVSGGRRLQCRDRAHQGRLAGPVGAQQAEHALFHGQIDVFQRLRPVGIDVRQVLDNQHDTAHPPVLNELLSTPPFTVMAGGRHGGK